MNNNLLWTPGRHGQKQNTYVGNAILFSFLVYIHAYVNDFLTILLHTKIPTSITEVLRPVCFYIAKTCSATENPTPKVAILLNQRVGVKCPESSAKTLFSYIFYGNESNKMNLWYTLLTGENATPKDMLLKGEHLSKNSKKSIFRILINIHRYANELICIF